MSKPSLSIGLMVYNGAATLPRVFDSLKAQTLADFEVIIADDASKDASAAVIKAKVGDDRRFRYVRHERNLGLAGNFAFVASQASSDRFTWLAQDDFYDDPQHLEKLVTRLAVGDVDFVFPAIKKIASQKDGSVKNLPTRSPTVPALSTVVAQHRDLMLRSYIGYQAIYGVFDRRILGMLPLWLNSIFKNGIPDEEPYCHFLLSRFKYAYVPAAVYVKDMGNAHLYKINPFRQLGSMIWNCIATCGILAQAPYSSLQKIELMAIKWARMFFVMGTILAAYPARMLAKDRT